MNNHISSVCVLTGEGRNDPPPCFCQPKCLRSRVRGGNPKGTRECSDGRKDASRSSQLLKVSRILKWRWNHHGRNLGWGGYFRDRSVWILTHPGRHDLSVDLWKLVQVCHCKRYACSSAGRSADPKKPQAVRASPRAIPKRGVPTGRSPSKTGVHNTRMDFHVSMNWCSSCFFQRL